MDKAYVVCGHSGSYSEYSMVVVKVFRSEEVAEKHRQLLDDLAKFKNKVYDEFKSIPYEKARQLDAQNYQEHLFAQKARLNEFVRSYPDVQEEVRAEYLRLNDESVYGSPLYYSDEYYSVEECPFE